ncbi:MAG: hypothetical protein HQL68_08655 [Magnetococcales bacterium]|nr:hypothetical protein [Magnetococcales bacterium]
MNKQKSKNSELGFTLAQMAVVILLTGILMNMSITTMRAINENTAVKVTKKRLEIIEQALVSFMTRNSRLPCPDTDLTANDGLENPGTAPLVCSDEVGLIPFHTLGLQQDIALDGWDNFFTYRIDSEIGFWATPTEFNLSDLGNIQVDTRLAGGGLVTPSPITDAILVVVSHGRNGFGSYTLKGTQTLASTGQYEIENTEITDKDSTFVDGEHTDNATLEGGAFDDILLVMRSANFIGGMEDQSRLKAQAGQELKAIKDSVIGFAASNISSGSFTLPTDITGTDEGITCTTPTCTKIPTDPWGSDYLFGAHPDLATSYVFNNSTTTSEPSIKNIRPFSDNLSLPAWNISFTTGDLFHFRSKGPDRIFDTSDDIIVYLSVSELKSLMIQDGSMKSGTKQLMDTFQKIHDALFSYASRDDDDPDVAVSGPRNDRHRLIFSASSNTDGLLDANLLLGFVPWSDLLGLTDISDAQDPWGNTIRYIVDSKVAGHSSENVSEIGIFNDTGSKTYNGYEAYRLISDGPDGILNTTLNLTNTCLGDDICVTIMISQLQSKFANAAIPLDSY